MISSCKEGNGSGQYLPPIKKLGRDRVLGDGPEGGARDGGRPGTGSAERAHPAGQLRHRHQRLEGPRREVLVGVAVGQHEAADPLRVPGDEHLATSRRRCRCRRSSRPPGRAPRGSSAIDRRDPVGGEVGVGLHRDLAASRSASRARCSGSDRRGVDDPVPEPAVDQVAVDEDDGLAPPRLPVADRPGR